MVAMGTSMVSMTSMATSHRGLLLNTLRTKKGQLKQLIKMVTLTTIPAVILIVFITIRLMETIYEDNELKQLRSSMEESRKVGNFIHSLQLELEEVTYFLSNRQDDGGHMNTRFELTDITLEEVYSWPTVGIRIIDEYYDKDMFSLHLRKSRNLVVERNITVTDAIHFYETLDTALIEWFTNRLQEDTHRGDIWKDLLSFKYIMRAKGDYGLVMAYGQEYLLMNSHISHYDYIHFVKSSALADDHLKSCFKFSNEALHEYNMHLQQFIEEWRNILEVKMEIMDGDKDSFSSDVNSSWHYDFAEYLTILQHVEDFIIVHMESDIDAQHYISNKQVSHLSQVNYCCFFSELP